MGDLHLPDGFEPIETAPRNGTVIQAAIPGHGSDNVILWSDYFVDENDRSIGGWVFLDDDTSKPPECWTDGVCWNSNEYGVASISPTAWKPWSISLSDLWDTTPEQQL